MCNDISKTSVLLRVSFYLQAIATFWLGYWSNQSLVFGVTNGTNWICHFSIILLLPLSILGLVDTLINDILPKRIKLKHALKIRHYVIMALAICYWVLILNSVSYRFNLAIIYYFGIQAIVLPLAAIEDVICRYGKPVLITGNDNE
jgi:CBS domain containing-hemolysin-like protein